MTTWGLNVDVSSSLLLQAKKLKRAERFGIV